MRRLSGRRRGSRRSGYFWVIPRLALAVVVTGLPEDGRRLPGYAVMASSNRLAFRRAAPRLFREAGLYRTIPGA